MIKAYENPVEFDISKNIEGLKILYTDLREISQGGPEVGTLWLNGMSIPNYLFGGPFLKTEDYFYVPVLVKKFFGVGFKLAQIDLNTLNISLIGNTKSLIFLERVNESEIFFFEDLNKTITNSYRLK